MSGIYKENMKAFEKAYPYFKPMFEKAMEYGNRTSCLMAEGRLYFDKDGKKYQACSRNQLEESRLLMRDIDFDRDNLIVVFGAGNIVFLEELIKESSDETRIAVYEPNVEIFEYILKHYSLLDIIHSEKLFFLIGSMDVIEKYITYFYENWLNLVLNMVVISLPNYYLYESYRLECIAKITKIFHTMFANMGNSLEDTMIGIDNQYINVDHCMASNSIDEIKGRYEGYPAIIVSSGPSLDKNIPKLKKAVGKALILACDASYRGCIANDVEPDIIASIERGIETYQYYYEGQKFSKDLVLVGPSVLRPEIFESIPGKKIIMAKSGIGVEGWWMEQFDTIRFRDLGHSCATAAFAAAQSAGCSPIILIGQDLAYTNDKIHGDVAHTEYEGDNKRNNDSEEVWTKDIYGNPIQTSDVYNTFRYYFENKAVVEGIKIVDATEGGAYISGSEVMTFDEALETFCTKEIPFRLNDILEERVITTEYKIQKYKKIITAVDDYIKGLETLQAKCREYHKGIIHYKDYDFDGATEEQLIEVIEVLTQNNQILPYLYEEHQNLLGYFMQNIKQTIINVKNLGNKITGKNVRRNWVLQINLIEMIDLASSVVVNEFLKIREFMEKKEEEEKMNV